MAAAPEVTTEVERAVEVLRGGGLVGLPTETVYGLAADAENSSAVRRVFAVKSRPLTHPLIVHVCGPEELERWAVEVPDAAHEAAERWWPGPLTLLLRRSARVLDLVTGGRDTVALRAPAQAQAHEVLLRLSGGVVAPSANRFGRVSPTSAEDVVADLGAAVDLVLDGGRCEIGVESTIVDLTGPRPLILRPGKVTAEELEEVLGPVGLAGGGSGPVAPGMHPSHYAPEAALVLLAAEAGAPEVLSVLEAQLRGGYRVGLLAPAELPDVPDGVVVLEPAGGPAAYARVLYQRLRQADAEGVERLVVVPPPAEGLGLVVADRLERAAAR